MKTQYDSKATNYVHSGTISQPVSSGVVSPIVLGTAQYYLEKEEITYPRYFNLPNQKAVAEKINALEGTEEALVFGSGMAAISTSLLANLSTGDHIIFQKSLYGGTRNLVNTMFGKIGIEYTFTEGMEVDHFAGLIQPNTKMIYFESPSNPLLLLADMEGIAKLAQSRGIITAIDSTFGSPVFQNPFKLRVDIVLHSATKYLGGHSDICAGIVAGRADLIGKIRQYAKCLGGSLDGHTSYLLERSIKTLGARVSIQAANAMSLAEGLEGLDGVKKVLYPGLASHPQHELAKKQMSGFGGMLSFELEDHLDPIAFQKKLKLIAPVVSLGGIESTICSPFLTSHLHVDKKERAEMGISDGLLRLSVGIEDGAELLNDLKMAFNDLSK